MFYCVNVRSCSFLFFLIIVYWRKILQKWQMSVLVDLQVVLLMQKCKLYGTTL